MKKAIIIGLSKNEKRTNNLIKLTKFINEK